jgi:conjugative transfer signal peptidase TraF
MRRRRECLSDAPLFAWGEAQPTPWARRSQLIRRMAMTGAGVVLVLLSAFLPPPPRLLWNASASAPIGLYSVAPGAWLERGDMAVAWVPERYRQLAADRRYLPLGVPLVKRVAAYGGDKVCAVGNQIFVDGRRAAQRQIADSKGRPMPKWSGCIRLHGREVFLLMDNPASFDGRYFGATKGAEIIGKARRLWRR